MAETVESGETSRGMRARIRLIFMTMLLLC
jgi:hypothetical protein